MSQRKPISSFLAINPPIAKRKYSFRSCIYSECKRRPVFGFGNKIDYCVHHRMIGMNKRQGSCVHGACFNNGVYGYPGMKHGIEKRCRKHSLDGMILFCKYENCEMEAVKGSRTPNNYCILHRPSSDPSDEIEALDIKVSSSDEEIALVERIVKDEDTTDEE